jgi:hypothetical protein
MLTKRKKTYFLKFLNMKDLYRYLDPDSGSLKTELRICIHPGGHLISDPQPVALAYDI